METIPVFDAFISNEEDGISVISIVDHPAVETNFMLFSKDEPLKFEIQDEEQRLISGVLMLSDTPIYRRDQSGEYYIRFSKEVLKQLSIKMLSDGTFKNISFQHNGNILPQNTFSLVEIFQKDSEKKIDTLFDNVTDGSLIATFKVNNNDIWNEIKSGNRLNGFSIEVMTSIKRETIKNNKNKLKMNISKFIKAVLSAFGSISTDKGIITYDGEEDLKVGDTVFDENGNPLSDGDYLTEDGKTIKVVDGVVSEIVDPEAEVEPNEEKLACGGKKKKKMEEITEPVETPTPEETPAPEVDVVAEIESLKSQIEEIKKILGELACEPAAEPIEEQFEKVVKKNDNPYIKLGEKIKNIRNK
mgnify:CR=1 FL=1